MIVRTSNAMKPVFNKAKRRLHDLQRIRNRYRRFVPRQQTAAPRIVRPVRKILIYESEYEFICRETLRMGAYRQETGGQLFGVETWKGTLLVTKVLGPGPDAQHSPAFFQQDIPFLEREADRIIRAGSLKQVGEWHSHHRLGLSVPSGRDSHSMTSTLRLHKEMKLYLLVIAVCDDCSASATPFMYNQDGYEICEWEIIPGESPVCQLLKNHD